MTNFSSTFCSHLELMWKLGQGKRSHLLMINVGSGFMKLGHVGWLKLISCGNWIVQHSSLICELNNLSWTYICSKDAGPHQVESIDTSKFPCRFYACVCLVWLSEVLDTLCRFWRLACTRMGYLLQEGHSDLEIVQVSEHSWQKLKNHELTRTRNWREDRCGQGEMWIWMVAGQFPKRHPAYMQWLRQRHVQANIAYAYAMRRTLHMVIKFYHCTNCLWNVSNVLLDGDYSTTVSSNAKMHLYVVGLRKIAANRNRHQSLTNKF